MQYRATITREGKHWTVGFPDCPGCQTFGKNEADAATQAREALEGWLEAHLSLGRVPPHPKARRGLPIAVNPQLAAVMQIRWRRDELGLTQGALAKRAGVSQQQIAKLEDPDGNPTLATLAKIAAALGLRVELNLTAA